MQTGRVSRNMQELCISAYHRKDGYQVSYPFRIRRETVSGLLGCVHRREKNRIYMALASREYSNPPARWLAILDSLRPNMSISDPASSLENLWSEDRDVLR